MSNDVGAATVKRGRPPRYLLSSIAVCGVCGARTRVGSQNASSQSAQGKELPHRYRVYECAGSPGATGFHVSIRQEYLDEIVTDAVLARVADMDFQTPRALAEDEDGTERRALRLEIKADYIWLEKVREAAELRPRSELLENQEKIVFPKIEAALDRIDVLENLDPLVRRLRRAQSALNIWASMPVAQQRHVVSTLVIPRIDPVGADVRGQRGPNADRVKLIWRTHAE